MPSRRTTSDSFACVFSSAKPNTTCTPAASSARARRMLVSSSKRARSSTIGGDRLAGLRRLDQRLDDRAVAAGAIQRLLHRDHVGVLRRLAQELHHDVEALERMVDDDVLGADGGEAVAAEIADALGEARRVGREQQVRPVIDDQLPQIDDTEDAVGRRAISSGVAPSSARPARAVPPACRRRTEMDRHAAPAALQRGLVGADQVLGLFLEFHVGVADQPEQCPARSPEAREQPVEEQPHQIFEHHEADRFSPVRCAGRRMNRSTWRAAAAAPACRARPPRAAAAAPSPGPCWG